MNGRYRFDVKEDGTWDNRKIFAFVDSGVPDGTHSQASNFLFSFEENSVFSPYLSPY